MDKKHNKKLVPLAKTLRKNMTREENHLWYDYLRNYPVRFARQKVIGNYIADFYCAKAKIIIELDGSQHYETNGILHDNERTVFFNSFGINVIRIPNNEIRNNFDGVCEYIDMIIKKALN